jgi:hypothetical protein
MKRNANNNVPFGTGTYKFIRHINDRFENAHIFTFCEMRKQKFQSEISRKTENNNEKTSRQQEPTGCTIYFQFIWRLTSTCFEQVFCSSSGITSLYRLVPPDDEQKTCSKQVDVNRQIKVNSASCWFLWH